MPDPTAISSSFGILISPVVHGEANRSDENHQYHEKTGFKFLRRRYSVNVQGKHVSFPP